MVLTGIVVSVCATGLALALADRVQAATGRVELGHDEDAADPADADSVTSEHHEGTPPA
jgi:hypothetical protein